MYIYMLAPPPKTHIFKDFLEKPKENNEFEMFSIHNQLMNELWSFRRDLYQI